MSPQPAVIPTYCEPPEYGYNREQQIGPIGQIDEEGSLFPLFFEFDVKVYDSF